MITNIIISSLYAIIFYMHDWVICTHVGLTVYYCIFFFTAIPSNMDRSSTTINVSRSTEAELVCPIPMSRVRDLLPVYQISWRQEEQDFPIIINREMLPYGVRLSPDNITLHVRINDSVDTRMYRCYLELRRCNITAAGIEDPCSEREVRGPTMTFNVYGKIFIYFYDQQRIICVYYIIISAYSWWYCDAWRAFSDGR